MAANERETFEAAKEKRELDLAGARLELEEKRGALETTRLELERGAESLEARERS